MQTAEIVGLFEKYVVGNYKRYPLAIVRGEGSYVWDAEGRRYLDLFPGWGVNGIGHCHPRVVAAVREQAGRLLHVANNFFMEPQARLAKLISEHSFGGQCFFCNSGAEANEAAMKLARRHAWVSRKEGEPLRYKIITAYNSFHGRTLAAVTATAQAKYHQGFYPLPAGFTYVPYDDAEAVAKAADEETCAVMVEPIQGEGGVNVPSDGYLPALRRLCDERGLILIFDEVQTGVGRTGKWFGYQHWGVAPDIMTLAKALGGGLAIGAMAARPQIAKAFVPGTHASTFGGNPIACAGGIATFEAIEQEGLLENAISIGKRITERLAAFARKAPIIRQVRGRGCLIGAELDRPGEEVVKKCMAEGLLINCTHDRVLRLLPSLAARPEEVDAGLDILERVLAAC